MDVDNTRTSAPDIYNDYIIPDSKTKIYKDECALCWHNSMSDNGLYICMRTFVAFCSRHVYGYADRSGQHTFLHWQRKIIDRPSTATTDEPKDKVTRLAIGVEGGFATNTFDDVDFDDTYSLVIIPQGISQPIDEHLNDGLLRACREVIKNEGALRMLQLESGVSAWDGETKVDTKHLNLHQIENPPQIASSDWYCQQDGCTLTTNLWLNLTDGVIKCGRSQYISAGVTAAGNNHMREHYNRTHYPLVVKLGTITTNADAIDVYSYDEDDAVRDPNLKEHLQHFGINIDKMEKTEKSTLELELDMNQKWEWAALQEDGANLELVYGPGLTGIVNIGSSCYINAAIQTLCMVPDFVDRFHLNAEKLFYAVPIASIHDDFNVQTAKLVHALMSGDYSKPADAKDKKVPVIKPFQFKRVIGRGHPEFSTARQQDVEEFIRYFLDKIEQNDPPHSVPTSDPVGAFRFRLENRIVDNATGKVSYTERKEVMLALSIDLQFAVNASEVAAYASALANGDAPSHVVRPRVPIIALIEALFADQHIDDFVSPVGGRGAGANQRIRFRTFPDYLLIQAQRFSYTDAGAPLKLDVELDVPERIDLERWRFSGPQPGEVLMDDNDGLSARIQPNTDVVNELIAMGFSSAACRKATWLTGNNSIEAATNWLMDHCGDADFDREHPDLLPNARNTVAASINDPVEKSKLDQLCALGFSMHQAKYALTNNENDLERSAEWLFMNPDGVPPPTIGVQNMDVTQKATDDRNEDASSKYRLVGFISHMGSSTHSGHYNDKWVLFNDEKVALSQNPPIAFGYLYLYQRVD